MLYSKVLPDSEKVLSNDEVRSKLARTLEGQFSNERVLVLIPDHTRSLPLPKLFRAMIDVLHDVKRLDFMVALGTHPVLDSNGLNKLVGITTEERNTKYARIGLSNHLWNDPVALETIGVITRDEVK